MSCIGPHNVFWKRKCFIADKQKRKIFSIICKQGPEGGMRNLFRISSLRKGGFLKNRRMAFFSVSPNVNICKFVIWIGNCHENNRKLTLVVEIRWTTARKFVKLICFPSIAPKQLGKCEHFLKASDISRHLSSVGSGKNSFFMVLHKALHTESTIFLIVLIPSL